MTNKNLPDKSAPTKTDKANDPTNAPKPEMGSARSANEHGNSRSHPEANDERRGLTRKSDATEPNPGRDITTGSDGFDGQGRERVSDKDRNQTDAGHSEKNADRESSKNSIQDEQRSAKNKEAKAQA